MSKNVRQGIYVALFLLNGGAVACVQQNLIPGHWIGVATAVSLVAAAMMKEFAAEDPPKEEPKQLGFK